MVSGLVFLAGWFLSLLLSSIGVPFPKASTYLLINATFNIYGHIVADSFSGGGKLRDARKKHRRAASNCPTLQPRILEVTGLVMHETGTSRAC